MLVIPYKMYKRYISVHFRVMVLFCKKVTDLHQKNYSTHRAHWKIIQHIEHTKAQWQHAHEIPYIPAWNSRCQFPRRQSPPKWMKRTASESSFRWQWSKISLAMNIVMNMIEHTINCIYDWFLKFISWVNYFLLLLPKLLYTVNFYIPEYISTFCTYWNFYNLMNLQIQLNLYVFLTYFYNFLIYIILFAWSVLLIFNSTFVVLDMMWFYFHKSCLTL